MTNEMIGLCVIGYGRPEYLRQCLESLRRNNNGGAHFAVVSLDYKDPETMAKNIAVCNEFKYLYIAQETNVGVGITKNTGLEYLMQVDNVKHLFVMEDDILMLRPDTCNVYIQAAQEYGIQHLNFAHHGPANGEFRRVIEFKDKFIMVHPHCIGAFSYYTRNCLDKVGLMDPNFKSAWEHVEHTYRIIQAGMHPPFWNFADVPNSRNYLMEIPGSIDNSSIRPKPDWKKNIQEGYEYWKKKHGKWLTPVESEWK